MIDKETCDKGFILNPNNYEFQCDKSCDDREYLDYANSKCRKILIDKLVKKCSENMDDKKLHSNEINDYGRKAVLLAYTLYC